MASISCSPGGLVSAGVMNVSMRKWRDCHSVAFRRRVGFFGNQHSRRAPLQMPVRSMSTPQSPTEELIKSKNEHNPVVVYSKTWCPYCTKVKGLFKKLGVKVVVVELDDLVDEVEVQGALKRLTGQSSVPNVFIGGKHIGGCDDTVRLHEQGKLVPLLEGARANMQG